MENNNKNNIINQRYAELLDSIAELIVSKNAKIDNLEEECSALRAKLENAESTIIELRVREA